MKSAWAPSKLETPLPNCNETVTEGLIFQHWTPVEDASQIVFYSQVLEFIDRIWAWYHPVHCCLSWQVGRAKYRVFNLIWSEAGTSSFIFRSHPLCLFASFICFPVYFVDFFSFVSVTNVAVQGSDICKLQWWCSGVRRRSLAFSPVPLWFEFLVGRAVSAFSSMVDGTDVFSVLGALASKGLLLKQPSEGETIESHASGWLLLIKLSPPLFRFSKWVICAGGFEFWDIYSVKYPEGRRWGGCLSLVVEGRSARIRWKI